MISKISHTTNIRHFILLTMRLTPIEALKKEHKLLKIYRTQIFRSSFISRLLISRNRMLFETEIDCPEALVMREI